LALERCLGAGIGSPGELELDLVFGDRIQLGLLSEFKRGSSNDRRGVARSELEVAYYREDYPHYRYYRHPDEYRWHRSYHRYYYDPDSGRYYYQD
jgi:hypothetical protein